MTELERMSTPEAFPVAPPLASTPHASPARPPVALPAEERLEIARNVRLRSLEAVERRRMVRGLLWLAFAVLLFSMMRAGADRVFVPGWWRQW